MGAEQESGILVVTYVQEEQENEILVLVAYLQAEQERQIFAFKMCKQNK